MVKRMVLMLAMTLTPWGRWLDRFALTYWHWSMAHFGRHNPSVDSIGVTMRLRNR